MSDRLKTYGMTDECCSPAVRRCVNSRRGRPVGICSTRLNYSSARRTSVAGADRFIGRRIRRLILICATTGNCRSLSPAVTDNGTVSDAGAVPATVPSVLSRQQPPPPAKQRLGYKLQLGVWRVPARMEAFGHSRTGGGRNGVPSERQLPREIDQNVWS